MRTFIAIVVALGFHAALLAFGGIVLMSGDKKPAAHFVEVKFEPSTKDAKKAAEKPKEAQDVKVVEEKPPDPTEIVQEMTKDAAPLISGHRFENVGLAEIEAALQGGHAGGGDFGALGGGFTGESGVLGASGTRQGGVAEQGAADDSLAMTVDQKPRPVVQTAPSYPESMSKKKIEATVTVIFVVDPSGRVTNQKVERTGQTAPTAFEDAALKAVKQWRFEPALRGGQPVSCQMRVPIRFDKS